MGLRTTQAKFVGSAGDVAQYYKEAADQGVDRAQSYYGLERDGILFSHVRGKAAEHLPGLDLARGLTRAQHAEIHSGKWAGEKLVSGNYQFVYETVTDDDGKKQKRKILDPVVNAKGEPVLDPITGEAKMKARTKDAAVAGHDVTFTCGKDVGEFLIAHPERTELVRDALVEAVDRAMEVIEREGKFVVFTDNGHKTRETAEGLLWFTVTGSSARPTPESKARGYETDVHVHAHCFVSSMVWTNRGWRKMDGKQLWQLAEMRADIATNEFNRILESKGVKIEYSQADKKGHIHSEIAGSNPEARRYFSTNSDRKWRLILDFEREHNRTPSHQELTAMMQATKARKTVAAKDADELGNLDQIIKWRDALERDGIELTIADVGTPKHRASVNARLDILFERMDRAEGIARDMGAAPVFNADAIMPAVYRCADGLGFTTEELQAVGGIYEQTQTVELADGVYTTQTILNAEADIAELFEHKAAQTGPEVAPIHVIRAVRGQRFSLDAEQETAVRVMCAHRVSHVVGEAGTGKCLYGGVELVDPRTGVIYTLEQVIHKPELTHVLSLRNRREVIPLPITAKIDSGWQPTLKITTASGRNLITTYNHPWLTPGGWKRADELTLHETTALARRIPEPLQPTRMDDEAVDLLAALLTNGNFTGTTGYRVDTADPEIVRRLILAGQKYGFSAFGQWPLSRRGSITYRFTGTTDKRPGDRLRPNTVRVLMDSWNVPRGLSKNKVIPDCVFSLPNDQLARFLAVFWMSDGYVDKGAGGPAIVMASEKMLLQLQHLLLRFGIQSGLKYKRAKCGGKYFDAWRLSVHDGREFLSHIPLWGEKRQRLTINCERKANPNRGYAKIGPELQGEILEVARSGRASGLWQQVWEGEYSGPRPPSQMFSHPGVLDRRMFKRFLDVYDLHERYGWLSEGDIWWDPIVSIEDAGEQHVYDLTVEPHANFVAGDIITHNSSAMRAGVDALRASGAVDEVITLAVGRRASTKLGNSIKADKSWSVEALRHHTAKGWKPTARTLVVFDEAAMANTFDIADTLRAIGPARLVTVSDSKQAEAIGPAGWLGKELERRQPTKITKVHRHSDWRDRRDYKLIREGDPEGLNNMAERGRIHAVDTDDALPRLARERWDYWHRNGREVNEIAVLHTGPNTTLDKINRAIQRERLDTGEIDEWATFDAIEHGGRRWTLHKNDRVIFNAGVYLDFHSDPILNGTTGTLIDVNPDGRVRVQLDTEDRRTVTVRLEKEAVTQPIGLGYCCSVTKYQGDETAIVLNVPGPQTTLNSLYSGVTRSTEATEVLLSRETWGNYPVQGLARACAEDHQKVQASEYLAMLDDELTEEVDDELDPDELTYDPLDREQALDRIDEIRRNLDQGPDFGLSL